MFSTKNAVLVAIMQIGVIVAGVLAAGLVFKAWTAMNAPLPLPAAILVNYGVLGFAIPLVWIFLALLLRGRPEVSDDLKNLVFWLGVLVLLVLGFFVVYADVSPWLTIMWRLA